MDFVAGDIAANSWDGYVIMAQKLLGERLFAKG